MQHDTINETSFARDASTQSTAKADRQAIHRILLPFSVAYFTAAFVTDLLYWRTAEVMWQRFSVWLIVAGLIVAGFAVIAAVIDLARGTQRPARLHALGYAVGVSLSLINVFIHSRDGYTAVVPTGLMLSGVAVVILLATASAGA
ncbi:DUF2231 domain-containing protein [Bradyrhizobium sp. Ash2021]|uniref:DUF2231 domain-containing protein n=1 Tax=Bradyrhizobium sp. Ash2021 TaxID=2954771 RepID=UPI0028165547|nr:DUF2231 domain-containing protein [Bradyrhizobium sp. Ash2021]WMT75422.1 DUF2231 domain-containing protein [Bradyrhizobium sp. Ash2021]WMT75933.1 DUF2231 domain-containing protein [Bradyrhizobium sp. Ash2021]